MMLSRIQPTNNQSDLQVNQHTNYQAPQLMNPGQVTMPLLINLRGMQNQLNGYNEANKNF